MAGIIRRPEILKLLGYKDDLPRNTFANLLRNSKLIGLPEPSYKDANGYFVYDHDAVIAFIKARKQAELEAQDTIPNQATITRREILTLIGQPLTRDAGYFNLLITKGRLRGFPNPIGKDGYFFIYDRKKALEFLGLSERDPNAGPVINFKDIFTGQYAPDELKTQWTMRRKAAAKSKPVTQRVSVMGDGW